MTTVGKLCDSGDPMNLENAGQLRSNGPEEGL